ncbi:hypothetical protein CL616_01240 [archaeon]|nr:hypothetical protein [archaeon]|tara:strand:- start:534 stop:770 length:237 start_codon:yes stop_codon:yes gene_type:complete
MNSYKVIFVRGAMLDGKAYRAGPFAVRYVKAENEKGARVVAEDFVDELKREFFDGLNEGLKKDPSLEIIVKAKYFKKK